MALSGNIDSNFSTGRIYRISWSGVQNVSANTTTITCRHYLINSAYYSLYIGARNNTCTVDGVEQTFTSPAISTEGGETHDLGTTTHTVTHNSDGTKTVTITGVFNIQATLSGKYTASGTASATVTLDTIPRASSITASAVNMGSATTISISRASSSFTHTLTYAFGSASGTITTKTTATSVSWTPPLTLANQVPNSTSGTCTITCQTYNGSTLIGTSTTTIKLTVPSTVIPSAGSLTATRVNGTVPSSWGIYVQSKSKAAVAISGASGSYGSAISSYYITGGGYTSTTSSLTTGFLNTSGYITFTATVTDSRGRTSNSVTVQIYVYSYSVPSFSSYLSQRCTSGGTVSDDGTYVLGRANYSYSSCNSKNTLTTSVAYRRSGVTSWTSVSATFSSGTSFVFGGGAISTEYSYEIRYTITDAFTSVSIIDTVSTAAVLMDFKSGGTGIAIGKVAEDDAFDVNFPAHFRKTVTHEGAATFNGTSTFNGSVLGFSRSFYGTTSTAAGTSIKVVTCADFKRVAGSVVTIYMTYANTVSLPRLNINSTGAAYMSYGGATVSGAYRWLAGSVVTVMFTGTYYEVLSIGGTWQPTVTGASTTYSVREGNFTYTGGILTISFSVNGTFLSTTTNTTALTITGLPFTNKGTGVAAGGGVAFGAYVGTGAYNHFAGWLLAADSSSIVGRQASKSTSNTENLGVVYNNPSGTFNLSGTIQMRALAA